MFDAFEIAQDVTRENVVLRGCPSHFSKATDSIRDGRNRLTAKYMISPTSIARIAYARTLSGSGDGGSDTF